MITLNQNSQTPIYDQIKLGLKGLVKKGLLKPGDAAPSIRKMALDLKVNPNTVARAARMATRLGVWMFNVHLQGGQAMCREAMAAAQDGGHLLERHGHFGDEDGVGAAGDAGVGGDPALGASHDLHQDHPVV